MQCVVVYEAASVVQLSVSCRGVCEKKYVCDYVREIDKYSVIEVWVGERFESLSV